MAQQIRIQAMGAREWMLLLALSVLWGTSFYFFKILDAEMPPFTLVLGRVGLAALALNTVLLVRGDPMPTAPKLWRGFLVMGLFMNASPCLHP
jgi:drug/metabolite transporter (DMT)-like permease